MAKQMADKLGGELANKENAMRETDQLRAVYEAKLKDLQNELNVYFFFTNKYKKLQIYFIAREGRK